MNGLSNRTSPIGCVTPDHPEWTSSWFAVTVMDGWDVIVDVFRVDSLKCRASSQWRARMAWVQTSCFTILTTARTAPRPQMSHGSIRFAQDGPFIRRSPFIGTLLDRRRRQVKFKSSSIRPRLETRLNFLLLFLFSSAQGSCLPCREFEQLIIPQMYLSI
jgi:hypothetical protein